MAENAGDKTEAPTPRRREEAREEGNVARSLDLTAAILLLGAIFLLKMYGFPLVDVMRSVVADMLSNQSMASTDVGSAVAAGLRAILMVGIALAPLFAGILVLAIVANIAQVGIFFSTKRLEPNLAALNPFRGIGKLFSGGQAAMSLLMSLTKLILVGAVAYSAINGRLGQIVSVQGLGYLQVFGLGAEIIYSIALRVGLLLLVLAVADYIWQRYRIERDLKMSKQEVKEEMKRMDGDPHIKQRRRQIAQQMAKNRMKKEVPKADVVVTNPTEYAIAIKYDEATMNAPRVVAKGRGLIAAEIRRIAIANGVPILERKPLARALFKLVDVGGEVPEEFYAAIAEILAYVYELTGKMRRRQAV
jgi:flagellar biosynthesis protein FlhB